MSLVIFDCDGVLVDTEGIANDTLAAALTGWGLPMTGVEARRRFMGRSMKAVAEELASELVLPEGWLDALEARDFATFRASLRTVPYVREAVERVEALGFATCVASSGSFAKMDVTLGVTGLLPLFAGRIFSAHQVARGKPHPDLFLFAAERMGHRPEGCVVVEDSVPGVKAAVAAGMGVWGYAGDPLTDAVGLEAAGARLFRDMRELPGLLSGS